MTLSKRFMDLGIGLKDTPKHRKTPSPQFLALSWHLLRCYLGAMVAVMGLSSIAVYQFFTYSLYQQLDQQLATVADAARHNFSAVPKPSSVNLKLPQVVDNDGDLDLPWQDLPANNQSVEWFDANYHRLGNAGKSLPQTPQQEHSLRQLTIPVYLPATAKKIQGYVRVSASLAEIQEEQKRLLTGLGVGGTIAILLIGGTGWWLTVRALQPIEQNIHKIAAIYR